MYANNLEQLISFSIFIIIGLIIGFIFDIFRVLRKVTKTPDFFTYIEDIFFWTISMFIILISIFIFNNGELRLYIFIGIISGVILYLIFISKYFIRLGIFCINTLKKIMLMLFYPLKFVLNIIKKLFLKPISFIVNNLLKKFLNFDKKT